jgi:hypothetical protein
MKHVFGDMGIANCAMTIPHDIIKKILKIAFLLQPFHRSATLYIRVAIRGHTSLPLN